jgi:hypothetical protein
VRCVLCIALGESCALFQRLIVCIFPTLGVNHRQSRDTLSKERKSFADKKRAKSDDFALPHLVIDVLAAARCHFKLWSKQAYKISTSNN